MIFDTHAHYDDKQFDQDREELLVSMKDNGIGTIVDVGSNMETSAFIQVIQLILQSQIWIH